MNIDVEIYLNKIINFFENNPNDLSTKAITAIMATTAATIKNIGFIKIVIPSFINALLKIMFKTISFVLLFSRLSITNSVWIISCPEFNPSSFFPIWFNVKIHTKLFSLSVEIHLIEEGNSNFFIVSTWSIAYLNPTNANRILKHFTPDFYLIGVRILINF